jgi:hypothetical protein
MRISYAALILAAFCVPSTGYAGQSASNAAPAQAAPGQTPTGQAPSGGAAPAPPSGALRPALDTLQQTIDGLKMEKWKGGSVRGEATTNINSIRQDLQSTLPSLLQDADAGPATVSKMLPVLRNVDALYDVLLRVFEAARVAAPGEQIDRLQQAAAGLDKGRRAFVDRLQTTAAAQEKQVSDLQVALKAQPVPVCPVTPASEAAKPAAAPARKAVRKKAKPPVKAPQGSPAQPAGTTTPKN